MPTRPFQSVGRDASLTPATVTQLSRDRPRWRAGTAASGRRFEVQVTRLHPLLLADLRRRTAHLAEYRVEYVSATEVVIR